MILMRPFTAFPKRVSPRLPLTERWASWLQVLFPIVVLVAPSRTGEPVRGLGLPGTDLQEDTSMLSAYYLSFYE
jgi:hypothetical protein